MNEPIDIQQLRANADAAGQLLKALANPDRLLLLCQLSQGERHVSELEALLTSVPKQALGPQPEPRPRSPARQRRCRQQRPAVQERCHPSQSTSCRSTR